MRKLYVLSQPIDGHRHLIGELTEENGEYVFKYRLGGKFLRQYLKLEYFPEPEKIYTGQEVRDFVDSIVPDKNLWCMENALKAAGLKEYDEWGFLIYTGAINPHGDCYLFENIPEGAVVYE